MESYREERRNSARVDMEGETVIITLQSDVDTITKPAKAICVDLSRRGALLQCTQLMPLGTLMTITFNINQDNENTVKGQVCRCARLNESSFHVALQLI
ncbi:MULTISPECIES: PilZ domain-containing protein [unclassified Shewanella]|uniref:PilZ domain-containing protein n=1 Tax=unclassified Shewanella TaxID=196818 RepID=UPI001BC2A615|nr:MULTISPECIES: PilZ domain-containing protein [unclassified Shewanella]GIU15499.1 pilus assembly protein PilZ [Shewanella sp. MBTL60-112-B1]GIU34963.1 pilus assembly protein PilZ [Shewanella sp. MBTL60-112-B2]